MLKSEAGDILVQRVVGRGAAVQVIHHGEIDVHLCFTGVQHRRNAGLRDVEATGELSSNRPPEETV